MRRFRKPVCSQGHRGFESLPLRHTARARRRVAGRVQGQTRPRPSGPGCAAGEGLEDSALARPPPPRKASSSSGDSSACLLTRGPRPRFRGLRRNAVAGSGAGSLLAPIPDAHPGCPFRMPIPDAHPGCPSRMPIPDAHSGCPSRRPRARPRAVRFGSSPLLTLVTSALRLLCFRSLWRARAQPARAPLLHFAPVTSSMNFQTSAWSGQWPVWSWTRVTLRVAELLEMRLGRVRLALDAGLHAEHVVAVLVVGARHEPHDRAAPLARARRVRDAVARRGEVGARGRRAADVGGVHEGASSSSSCRRRRSR